MMNEKWKSAFDQIHAEETLKEHTKEYLARTVYSRRSARPRMMYRFAAAAAALVLFAIIGGSWIFLTPTAYISIDINPSLELGINRFDRIISVDAYNEDGEDLAESFHVTFMDYNEALEEILSSRSIESYLSQDARMSLTVAGDNETQYAEIMDTVERCSSEHKNVSCHSADTGDMHDAHEAGLSFGKYRAYLILKELDPSVTPEDIQDLTMREIYDRIDALSGGRTEQETEQETGQKTEREIEQETGHDSGHHEYRQHHSGREKRETE